MPEAAPAPAEPTPAPQAEPAPADPAEPKAAPAEPAPKETPTPSPDDWRAGLTSDDAKKYAERFPDVGKLVDGALEMRKQLSSAIVPPGKDAKPEVVAAYRKRIGVPESAEGYKFAMPEGVEASEADKAIHGKFAEAFHNLDISSTQAQGLNAVFNELTTAVKQAEADEDKKFAEESTAALRRDWPGDEFAKNEAHANRAAAWMFGDQVDEARALQTKDGRFIMDHPVMLRALAAAGREMAEGGLVPPMSKDAAEQAQDEVTDLRKRISDAQGRGDTREANRLFQEEQKLLSKIQGNRPVVGSQGRAA